MTDDEIVALRYKAVQIVVVNHGNQTWGDEPYFHHCVDVERILTDHGFKYERPDHVDVLLAGLLHDVIEDTDYNKAAVIANDFNGNVYDIVIAVSNEDGANRSERFRKTLDKTIADNRAVCVKLADRISNTKKCITTKHRLLDAYIREWSLVKKYLDPHHRRYANSPYLAQHLVLWETLLSLMTSIDD